MSPKVRFFFHFDLTQPPGLDFLLPPKTDFSNKAKGGMWGVPRSVCSSPSRILRFFPFWPHLVPRDLAKGSLRPSPSPPKTEFFQTKQKMACGVSPEVSASSPSRVFRFFYLTSPGPLGPRRRILEASERQTFLNKAKFGMCPRSVWSSLSRLLRFFRFFFEAAGSFQFASSLWVFPTLCVKIIKKLQFRG